MERWVWPSLLLTLAMGGISVALMPVVDMVNTPKVWSFWMWMTLMLAISGTVLLFHVIKMLLSGVESPIAELRSNFDLHRALPVLVGCAISGLNIAFFGWMKPILGQLVPFTADPWLADLDLMIFGTDPWLLIGWFEHPFADRLYHQFWFVFIAAVLLAVLVREPSREKNAIMVGYFCLWTILGPLLHLSMPAAGPLFYDEFGHGDRFIELVQPDYAALLANYLWEGYTGRVYNPGGGISAMPSLHIATMAWTVIALWRTKWVWLAIIVSIYMWIGSIYLGWHYWVDGLAGAIGALAIHIVLIKMPFWQRRKRVDIRELQPEAVL